MTTRLSTKGQLILPKEIRERRGCPGVELEIEDRGNSVVLRRAVDVPETTLEELLGCTGYQGPAHSLEEMEAGIARGALRTCEGAPVVELVSSP
jgi:AbrB family looped-hinge helix DNA binding protein